MIVWQIQMAVSPSRHSITNTYHVTAASLRDALSQAEKLEQEWTDDMTESEGEQFIPAEPIGITMLCQLDS